jgi:hypothetical protein
MQQEGRTKMSTTSRWSAASILALALTFMVGSPLAAEPQEEVKETYNVWAVAMGTSNPPVIPPGVTATLQIRVSRWSTDEERVDLLTQLLENGQEGMVKTLQKQEETGFIRNTTASRAAFGRRPGMAGSALPSERLRYAREFKGEGGRRRLVLALDRPISFAESVQQPRWRDYDVTLIVMDLDAEGNGVGQLAMGVRLAVDQEKKALVIENFGSEPVRLSKISMSK